MSEQDPILQSIQSIEQRVIALDEKVDQFCAVTIRIETQQKGQSLDVGDLQSEVSTLKTQATEQRTMNRVVIWSVSLVGAPLLAFLLHLARVGFFEELRFPDPLPLVELSDLHSYPTHPHAS